MNYQDDFAEAMIRLNTAIDAMHEMERPHMTTEKGHDAVVWTLYFNNMMVTLSRHNDKFRLRNIIDKGDYINKMTTSPDLTTEKVVELSTVIENRLSLICASKNVKPDIDKLIHYLRNRKTNDSGASIFEDINKRFNNMLLGDYTIQYSYFRNILSIYYKNEPLVYRSSVSDVWEHKTNIYYASINAKDDMDEHIMNMMMLID